MSTRSESSASWKQKAPLCRADTTNCSVEKKLKGSIYEKTCLIMCVENMNMRVNALGTTTTRWNKIGQTLENSMMDGHALGPGSGRRLPGSAKIGCSKDVKGDMRVPTFHRKRASFKCGDFERCERQEYADSMALRRRNTSEVLTSSMKTKTKVRCIRRASPSTASICILNKFMSEVDCPDDGAWLANRDSAAQEGVEGNEPSVDEESTINESTAESYEEKLSEKNTRCRIWSAANNDIELDRQLGNYFVCLNQRNRSDLPYSVLESIPKFTCMDCSVNLLNSLSIDISKLTTLRELNLSFNNFREFPLFLLSLTRLQYVDISSSKLELFPNSLNTLRYLRFLIASNNRIKHLPQSFSELNELLLLDLSFNRLKTFLDRPMSNLCVLNLSHNHFRDVPNSVCLSPLLSLNMSYNMLEYLPENLSSLRSLLNLEISNNKIVCSEVSSWRATLRTLDLSYNSLVSIPSFIYTMRRLWRLDLSYNKIYELSKDVVQLESLVYFDVSNNCLDSETEEMISSLLENKESVSEIKSDPDAVLNSNHTTLGKSLEQLKENRDSATWCHMKLGLIGAKESGKSSLEAHLSYYFSIKFRHRFRNMVNYVDISEVSSYYKKMSTESVRIRGCEAINYSRDRPPVVFSIWDFAGQEEYMPIHQLFITPNGIYVLTFKLTSVDIASLGYWLKMLKVRTGGRITVLIVGTYRDKIANKRVCKSLFEKMHRHFSMWYPFIRGYLAISNKTEKGMQKLVNALLDLATGSQALRELVPRTYLTLKTKIKGLVRTSPIICLSEFQQMMLDTNIAKEDIGNCLEVFRNAGLVIHFDDENTKVLKNLVILNSSWLVSFISSIIYGRQDVKKTGLLFKEDLTQIWHKYDNTHREWMFKILEAFEIVFLVPSSKLKFVKYYLLAAQGDTICDVDTSNTRDTSGCPRSSSEENLIVIPCLSPVSPNPSTILALWNNSKLLDELVTGRRYEFEFVPLSLFFRLIIRTINCSWITILYFWKNGMIIDTPNERALVVNDEANYCLNIFIRQKFTCSLFNGPASDTNAACNILLIQYLADSVETLLFSWYRSKPIVLVPCYVCLTRPDLDFISLSSADVYYFFLEECILAARNGIEYLVCRLNTSKQEAHSKQADSLDRTDPANFQRCVTHGRVSFDVISRHWRLFTDEPDTTGREHTCLLKVLCSHVAFPYAQDIIVDISEVKMKKKVGESSYSVIWCGTYKDEPVAIKFLKDQTFSQATFLSESYLEFHHEMFIMQRIDCQYLLMLKGFCPSPLSIIFEFFPLGSLYSCLNEKPSGPFDWKYRLRVAENAARGIAYMHSKDLIHRDLRSPNVLISSMSCEDEIVAKVSDFGMTVFCSHVMRGGEFNECWAAPEVLNAEEYNEKIDQYSFGIILWELLQLGHPFLEYAETYAGKPRLIFFAAITEGLRPSIPSDCPPEYAELIRTCWNGDPDARPTFSVIVDKLVSFGEAASTWPQLAHLSQPRQ